MACIEVIDRPFNDVIRSWSTPISPASVGWPLPCLSRLMNQGIGEGKTRADHRGVADQLYAYYAEGVDLRRLVAIIGEEALSENDRLYLKFADEFEEEFQNQAGQNRDIEETLQIGWRLLSILPSTEIKRIKMDYIKEYFPGEIVEEGVPLEDSKEGPEGLLEARPVNGEEADEGGDVEGAEAEGAESEQADEPG